jgi:hypothetical protein
MVVNELLNLLALYTFIIILPAYFIIDWVNYHISSTTKSAIVLSLGIAPLLMSGLLYFLLVLLPNQSALIYLAICFGLIISFNLYCKKQQHQIASSRFYFNKLSFSNTEKTIAFFLFFLFLLSLAYSAWRPLTEHDTFEYMFLGKQLALKTQLSISNYRFDATSGSFFVGLHGLLYPLLYTWQVFLNQIMHIDSEWWFKSLSGFYTILFIAMFTSYLKIINHRLMVFGLCLLLTTYAMVFSMLQFHLEMIRLFLFVAVLYVIMSFIKTPKNQLNLLGLVFGLQAGIHFIGLVISILGFVLVFFFLKQSFINRIKMLSMPFITFLFAGALHYLLEYLLGDGYWWQKITGN